MRDYKRVNREAWNLKTEIHLDSNFYNNDSFIGGESSLNEIELGLLGNVRGRSILHLQCHFGQDTISLSRLGAKVTGVDLSDRAIEVAREMAAKLEVNTKFVCSDIYELPNVLDEKFDIVYTSYGVIGWLPDMAKWAQVVARYLKPNGRFVMVEFHPVVWMFDDDFREIAYRYFNSGEIVEQLEGSYANRDAEVQYTTVCWNHSLSEVINSLIKAGVRLSKFEEYDYSPYNCFKHTVQVGDNYRIKHLDDKIPMIYAIEGVKSLRLMRT